MPFFTCFVSSSLTICFSQRSTSFPHPLLFPSQAHHHFSSASPSISHHKQTRRRRRKNGRWCHLMRALMWLALAGEGVERWTKAKSLIYCSDANFALFVCFNVLGGVERCLSCIILSCRFFFIKCPPCINFYFCFFPLSHPSLALCPPSQILWTWRVFMQMHSDTSYANDIDISTSEPSRIVS